MRICYNCTYMDFSTGHPGYSEYTPGESMSMSCLKDKWHLDDYAHQDDLRKALETANHCELYEHSENAIELGIQDVDYAGFTHYHSKPLLQPHVLLKTAGNGKILNIVHIKANHGGYEAGAIQIIVQKNDDTIITSRPFSLGQKGIYSLYNYLTYNLGLDIPKDDMFDIRDLVNQEVLVRD